MKKNTKTKKVKSSKPPESIADVLENRLVLPSLEKLSEDFVRNVEKDFAPFGGNEYLKELLQVAKSIILNYNEKPFCKQDFLNLSNFLQIDYDYLSKFFEAWVLCLEKAKRLNIIRAKDSCYEYDSYCVIV